MINLFVYGTLTEKKVQKSIIGREFDVKKARLYEYSLKEAIWCGVTTSYKTIAYEKGKKNYKVEGMILSVSDTELKKIDVYESYPQFYKKINVNVIDEDGKIVECLSYINAYFASSLNNKTKKNETSFKFSFQFFDEHFANSFTARCHQFACVHRLRNVLQIN